MIYISQKSDAFIITQSYVRPRIVWCQYLDHTLNGMLHLITYVYSFVFAGIWHLRAHSEIQPYCTECACPSYESIPWSKVHFRQCFLKQNIAITVESSRNLNLEVSTDLAESIKVMVAIPAVASSSIHACCSPVCSSPANRHRVQFGLSRSSAFARTGQRYWQNNILQATSEHALVKDSILLWPYAKLAGLVANCYPKQ